MKSREGIYLTLLKCHSCKHLFQEKTDYEDIYSDSSFSFIARGNSATPGAGKVKELDDRAFSRFEFYRQLFSGSSSVLEIGSSIGAFVHVLRLNGKDAHGLEPDPTYSGFSENQYFFRQESVLFENYRTDRKFDMICSFHVIEHVKDIKNFVERCYLLLNDKGRILLECPSWEIRNYGRRIEMLKLNRIHYFSLVSIYRLLAGFFEIDSFGINGSALYISGKKKEKDINRKFVPVGLRLYSFYAAVLRIILPAVSKNNGSVDILRQLKIQVLLDKRKFKSVFKKVIRYSSYTLRERIYLRKERGNGKTGISHITNFKGWGNNSGDVVLSKCVRDVFRIKNNYHFHIIPLKQKVDNKLIDRINQTSFLLIGGGGLFLPDTNKNSISGWQWAVSAEQLQNIQKPVFLFAIGYNYFRGQEPNPLFLENLQHILEKAEFAGIRNFGSIEKINELTNCRFQEKIRYQPCPTTIISKIHPNFRNDGKKRNRVAVNIAFDRYPIRFGKNIYSILDETGKALKEIEKSGYEIINASHISADERFRIILDRHRIRYRDVRLQHMLPEEVYRFYSEVDMVIGMRGHAQMIPFGLGTPVISLGTHDKMKWFLEDMDASDWYIDLNNEDRITDRIVEKFNIISRSGDEVRKRIFDKQEILFNITMDNIGFMEEIFRKIR